MCLPVGTSSFTNSVVLCEGVPVWLLQGVGGWRVACVVGESGMPGVGENWLARAGGRWSPFPGPPPPSLAPVTGP